MQLMSALWVNYSYYLEWDMQAMEGRKVYAPKMENISSHNNSVLILLS